MMEKYNINATTLSILNLYAKDYRSTLHLREASRAIRIDVKAVQMQMKRLERMGVLYSSFKGRNKEYRLNMGNSITKHYIALAEHMASIKFLERSFLIKKIAENIEKATDGIVILFGSFAKGIAGKGSDIDLLIVSDSKVDSKMIVDAGKLVGREVNIVKMTKARFSAGLREHDPLVLETVMSHVLLKNVDAFCEILWDYYAK